ncbi:ABC transporter permease [Propionibacteriaceae bacterium Y1685]|uniref:ABC transporter permease n=1 Tax=Microlunatus sp. Y1700 TaxID=3418487 RepID=UPI003B81A573
MSQMNPAQMDAVESLDTDSLDLEAGGAGGPKPTEKRLTRNQLVVRRFLRNKGGVIGLAVIICLVLLAVIGPLAYPWKFNDVDNYSFLKPPSGRHWMGTTQDGRDLLALTMRGLGKSLIIGFCVAILSTAIAALVGSFAAYFGGWFEAATLWIIDLLLVIPSFLLIAIMTKGTSARSATQNEYAWLLLVLLLTAFSWVLSARVVRSLAMSIKEREYIAAAKFMGLPAPVVIVRHLIPNIASLLIIDATLNVSGAILTETSLSYFGFGVQAPDTSLGTLIGNGQQFALTFPWLFLVPAVLLVILVFSVNAVGDGLRDAIDPSSSSGGKA